MLPRAAAGDGAAACVQVRVLPSLPPSLPLCVPLSVSASAGLSPDLPLPSSALGAFQSRKLAACSGMSRAVRLMLVLCVRRTLLQNAFKGLLEDDQSLEVSLSLSLLEVRCIYA